MDKSIQTPIAEELAKRQKSISVAEFFEKNRHILGFDSAPRALITTVKEAVDNSLDACEEAGILPDILVQVERGEGDYLIIIVEDNGPGIVKAQIPKVFAKLLYGSRFHALKQSRGQQGIGISAAVLYSQITAGKYTKIISRVDHKSPAHYFELMINTSTNEPDILKDEIIEWVRPHGTRIEIEMGASYVKGRKQSVYEYLKSTAIINPHARIRLVEPDGNEILFERATDEIPKQAEEVLPHPHGIELGTLIKMLQHTERQKLAPFLRYSFSKIGLQTAEEICDAAGLDREGDPHDLTRNDAMKLLDAFKKVKIMAPSTNSLSPITEDLIYKGLKKEYSVDFIATAARKPAIYSGNPFVIEVGIAYGGNLPKEDKVNLMRFANRVPLLYQQGACALTHAVENIKWKQYGIGQPGGGLPIGPFILLIHIASVNVPFTSESKDAVADIEIIEEETELAVKEVARKLKTYLGKQGDLQKRREKEVIITKILPLLAKKVSSIVDKDVPDIQPVVANIMGNLLVKRTIEKGTESQSGVHFVSLSIRNYGATQKKFKLHQILPGEIKSPSPPPTNIVSLGNNYDYIWDVTVSPAGAKAFRFMLEGADENELKYMEEVIVEGLEEDDVTGAKAVGEF
ncbi:DNA topoisomerase 6 subunit B [Methanosarcinaceae archaeon Ag5]|uniref:Type 2 DNA topoisomerase 6 subunit B n=1 Tax=Methanolapillus africanus TaxID=3028297 RepID=A0AAE4MKX8_9EURY|nr:DNA topoisomerase 6 subunit B [Methanosarcinaceae archaeon Ag5]